MPKGPRGEKRPADVVGAAVLVGRIAIGEVEDTREPPKMSRAEIASRGGKARAAVVPARKRSEIARKAARAKTSHAGAAQKTDQES